MKKGKKVKKVNTVLLSLKILAILVFVIVPVSSWKAGQNFRTRLHKKENEI